MGLFLRVAAAVPLGAAEPGMDYLLARPTTVRSTGLISDCSMANEPALTNRRAKVSEALVRGEVALGARV
jgi:hypothetical protein